VFLYLDDGFPESRDYDDNYLEIDPTPPQGVVRELLRLPPLRPCKVVREQVVPRGGTPKYA